MTTPLALAPVAQAADSSWDRLAECESNGNWAINTGNGFSGGLQFTPGTWRAFGGSGQAHHASREQQIAVAERVLAKQGWGAWPACSRKLGLRGKPAPSGVSSAPQATTRSATAAKPAASAPTGGGTVTVERGDTLAGIASDAGVSLKALRAANPQVSNPHRIVPGQVLNLP